MDSIYRFITAEYKTRVQCIHM